MDIGQILNALLNVHPLHTLMVHFPIALTGTALIFLLLALWRKHDRLEHAAWYVITLAALMSVVAGVTGMRDNIIRFEGGAPYALSKMFMATSLFVLTAILALARRRWPNLLWNPSTMMLYVVAFAGSFGLAAALGFLGGVILYGI
jgi:uncharacterized membrane protein